jgi:hypothetical protein
MSDRAVPPWRLSRVVRHGASTRRRSGTMPLQAQIRSRALFNSIKTSPAAGTAVLSGASPSHARVGRPRDGLYQEDSEQLSLDNGAQPQSSDIQGC